MLRGIDISHHNDMNLIQQELANADFCIVKATEGKTYTDPALTANCATVISAGKALGLYHYARPENNSPEDEAKHFVETIKPYLPLVMLALDWEGNALALDDIEWPLRWMNYVYAETGIMPMFYTSYAYAKVYEDLADYKVQLWLARYNTLYLKEGESLGKWGAPLIWQYTSTPIDRDYFYGEISDLHEFISSKVSNIPTERKVCCRDNCLIYKSIMEGKVFDE